MRSYAASQVARILDRGPQPDEGFFRLKVTGQGESAWVNVTPGQLFQIMKVLEDRQGID